MAEKRMFAKSIVLTDAFLDMPMSARCLYFTLGMLADDDGFVGSPKSVMRQCGASQDDIAILLQKRFVLGFESGVLVIKHWRINNYLQRDRIKPTTYQEELATLMLDKKGAYTEREKAMYTGCIQPVYTEESSIVERSIEESSVVEKDIRRGSSGIGAESPAISFFLDRINPYPSETSQSELLSFVETLGDDVVLHALHYALDEHKTGWSYIKAILRRYEKDGLRDIASVLESEQRREQTKGKKGEKKTNNIFAELLMEGAYDDE